MIRLSHCAKESPNVNIGDMVGNFLGMTSSLILQIASPNHISNTTTNQQISDEASDKRQAITI